MTIPPPRRQAFSSLRRRVTRRWLLRNAAAASGGLVMARVVPSLPDANLGSPTLAAGEMSLQNLGFLVGQISRIDLPDRVELDPAVLQGSPDVDMVTILLRPDALVGRGVPTSLAIFEGGEEVVAEGAWDGDIFRASSFANMFRFARGQMTMIDHERGLIQVDSNEFKVATGARLILGESVKTGADLPPSLVGANVAVNFRLDPNDLPVVVMINVEDGAEA